MSDAMLCGRCYEPIERYYWDVHQHWCRLPLRYKLVAWFADFLRWQPWRPFWRWGR